MPEDLQHEKFHSMGLLYLHHKETKAVVKHTALTNQSLKFVSHIGIGFKKKNIKLDCGSA